MRTGKGKGEQGSVLIITVLAMLIMGVLSVSFALLANVESKIGVNYRQQGQAEALAEAGLERARDSVRGAVATNAFTSLPSVLHTNVALGPGTYFAAIDNDCAPLVPAAIQDPNCLIAGSENVDGNVTAVLTAWATAGTGRSRVRAVVAIDDPWRHVCSNASPDNPPGYCNEAANRNGNPTIEPADPNDPNGPAAYDELPRPILGCSRVDSTLHRGANAVAQQLNWCGVSPANAARQAMFTYPYPAHILASGGPGAGNAPRFVVMGQDPAVAPGPGQPTPKSCNGPVPATDSYFGYFDCALTTPCPAGVSQCNAGAGRQACVRETDSRAGTPGYAGRTDPDADGIFTCPAGATGMLFIGDVDFSSAPQVGSNAQQFTIYVMNGEYELQSNTVYGTVIVEGLDGSAACSSEKDVKHKNGAVIWTGTNTGGAGAQYGYPLAYLVYNPELADPTITPTYAPQPTCLDMGSAAGTEIHGLVYSGGNVEVNPIVLDGGVIAFQIQTQSSSSIYGYNLTYGNAAPPPGFPVGTSNLAVLSRKSFVVCSNYSTTEATARTACQ